MSRCGEWLVPEGDTRLTRGKRTMYVDKSEMADLVGWCNEPHNNFAFGIELDMPSSEQEWKQILKNPAKFTAKSLHKGAEVSWAKLSAEQKKAMAAAKNLEIEAWLKELVCEKYRGVVPASRLMKMRWVLTFKGLDHSPSKMKAKARLVLLGYSDPDLLELQTSSPTMTRRSRQLLLSLCTHKRWRLRKADAKSAFLQGSQRERDRNVFTVPVPELSQAL